jgi:anthraniloyl-CoA monooxygenase
MRIVSIGGGPAGLYTSILLKKALPQASISVYERNRADDTFGWGVVFSSETLSGFELADAPSYRRITEEFRYWDDIETYALGECVRSTGHGFCGMSRRKLLMILQERAAELGVELLFETDVPGVDAFADASLILGADGIHSQVRAQFEDRFQPSFDWRKCKFAWFGTSRPLDAFTFHFKQTRRTGFGACMPTPSTMGCRPGSSSAARRPGGGPASMRQTRRRSVEYMPGAVS